MRFVFAIVSLVIAVALGGYGVAQQTFLNGPDALTATSEATSDATVTVVGGETLNSLEGRQDLRISGSDTIFAAYGRTGDILAWIGNTTYNRIGFDPKLQELFSVTQDGAKDTVPAPAGSDLWLREFSGENSLDLKVSLDEDLSIILVSDGTKPAPSTVSITWPLDNRTPWAGPLIAAGGVMLVLALIFFFWGLVHRRRTRGPRRKGIKPPKAPRMPRLPRQRTYRVRKPDAIKSARGRRSTRRMTAILPVVLVGMLALSGCSSDLWPNFAGQKASPSPSPSSTVPVPPAELQPPVTTVRQVESIVRDVSTVAEASDAALDGKALEARFAGPALALRVGNYAIRAKDSAFPPLPAIPDGPVEVTLPELIQPQQSDTWPRSVFAVVVPPADDSTQPPTELPPIALTLVQQSPREQYKVNYAVALEPNAVLPELAPEGVGVPRLGPDSKLLSMPPGQLTAAYLDVLNLGTTSESYKLFDMEHDDFFPTAGPDGRAARKAKIPATASIEFAVAQGKGDTIALASNESGALVTVSLTESETVKPVEAGATINPEGAIKTLSGLTGTTKGVTASYGDQLLFYIPPIGSSGKIVLLGFSQGLISAQEIA